MDTVSMAAELDHRFGIPGVAKVCEGNGGLPRVRITGAFGEGEVYLHGAHVTSWKPAGNDEVLFVSTKSHWQEGRQSEEASRSAFPGSGQRRAMPTLRLMDSRARDRGSSSPLLKAKRV